MMRRLPQDQLAPPHRRDRRRASTHERAHAPRILRRDPGLHRQPCDAIPALRRGRPAVQTARERRRAEVRRPAVHVQPRAGRALLPLSLPEAAVARGYAELRGDRDLGRCDGCHWEFAGPRGDHDHRRVARQVSSLIQLMEKRKRQKSRTR
jgi:hypothetical protein